jgi:hypothetical protein
MKRRWLQPEIVGSVVVALSTIAFLVSRYPFDRRPPSWLETVVVVLIGGLSGYGVWRFGKEPHPRLQRWLPSRAGIPEKTRFPWDRTGDDVRRTMTAAQREALALNHNYIGTEHMLLALIADGGAEIDALLMAIGVDAARVRSAVLGVVEPGDTPVSDEIGLTPRSRRSLEMAVDEARRGRAGRIGNTHLLLGLTLVGDSIAAGVLRSMGVTPARLRAAVRDQRR